MADNDAHDVVMRGADAIRRRPGMYIGDVDQLGLHHLAHRLLRDIFEGRQQPTSFRVTIEGEALTIEDDRRMPVPDPVQMRSVAEEPWPGRPSALHCCNFVPVSNALSREFVFELWADGVGLRSDYARGELQAGPRTFTPTTAHGCRMRMIPDELIFASTRWIYGRLVERLQVLAGLYAGVHVELCNRDRGHTHKYVYPRGPASWIEQLAPSGIPRPALLASAVAGELRCDIGWTWVKASGSRVLGYTNTDHNRQGGSHTEGFRDAIGQLGRARGLYPFALVSV
ncbi:MAG TPA: hypothetical protein VM869_30740, partial [Enhygromyxa sp.]|nr:hypothetical protein [Enhygromyxa sp.]